MKYKGTNDAAIAALKADLEKLQSWRADRRNGCKKLQAQVTEVVGD